MSIFEVITIIIAIIAAGVAMWQGVSAHKQVKIAETTNDETRKLMEEIKKTVEKVKNVSTETKKEVEKQIDKLVDNQNDHQKTLMENFTKILSNFDPKTKQDSQMGEQLLSAFLSGNLDMEKMTKLAEFGNNLNKQEK